MPHFPVLIARAGTVAIAAGAFWLSFTALQDLAVRSFVPSSQAWVWPLIVDGLVIVATVAVIALEQHRWYAWTLLGIGASTSLAGNTLHATYTGELPLSVRVLVAAVPPLALLAVTHLTYLLSRSTAAEPEVAASGAGIEVVEQADNPVVVGFGPLYSKPTAQPVVDLGLGFREARKAG